MINVVQVYSTSISDWSLKYASTFWRGCQYDHYYYGHIPFIGLKNKQYTNLIPRNRFIYFQQDKLYTFSSTNVILLSNPSTILRSENGYFKTNHNSLYSKTVSMPTPRHQNQLHFGDNAWCWSTIKHRHARNACIQYKTSYKQRKV